MLNDTGVGTTRKNAHLSSGPPVWTLSSFLEHTINPGNKIPYLVILSHCHYDHILGLKHLVPSRNPPEQGSIVSPGLDATVLASSHDRAFLTPWKVLNYHSLCEANKIPAPHYDVGIWAEDYGNVTYTHPSGVDMDLDVVMIHTPGHTPDSLTWYDVAHRHLYVGDSLYQQESDETRNVPPSWVKESPGPIMFTLEGVLFDWWQSINKVIAFVERENARPGVPRVKMGAGHITAETDAWGCLVRARQYMARILRDEVPCWDRGEARGEPMGHWTDDDPKHIPKGLPVGEFSVCAPIRVIEKGRTTIPKEQWASLKIKIKIAFPR